jgi:hypothetical protein
MLEIELRKTHDARLMELSSLRHEVERLRARESPPRLTDHGEGAPSRQPR